jgi:hypothetical protein
MLTHAFSSFDNNRKVIIMAKDPKTFWGGVLAIASSVPALGGGLIHGTINELTGQGSFEEGFNQTASAIWDTATDIGDEHGDKITAGVVTTIASALTGKALEHTPLKHNPPKQ